MQRSFALLREAARPRVLANATTRCFARANPLFNKLTEEEASKAANESASKSANSSEQVSTNTEEQQTNSHSDINSEQPSTKPPRKSLFSWKALLIQLGIGGLAVGGLLYYNHITKRKQVLDKGSLVKTSSYGTAQVGGPFTLVDTEGRPVTDADFRGRFMFMYLGFTNCPDICPEEMQKMTKIVNAVEAKLGPNALQPVFISCDPRRDSCAAVKEYLKDYHPRFIGLTGTYNQIKQLATKYRMYFSSPDESEIKDNDYLVDHSILMYLIGPNGKFIDFFTKNMNDVEASNKIIHIISTYIKQQGNSK